MSDYGFHEALSELDGRLADAQRRGDDQAAYEALMESNTLRAREPRLPMERVMSHAAGVVAKTVEGRQAKVRIPPPVPSRLWNKRKRGR